MSLKETIKKWTVKTLLILVSVGFLIFNGMLPQEKTAFPTKSQINRMQELTPLYQAYKIEQEDGAIEKNMSFNDYIDRNPEYKKIYNGVILFGHEFPGNRIEIRGVEEKSKEFILYDDAATPDLDWFKGSEKPKPDYKEFP